MAKKEKFTQGIFTPQHPEKYAGKDINKIFFRSGWESSVMRHFDTHPYVLQWSSESVAIKYLHPFKKKRDGRPMVCTYWPDFVVTYIDQKNKKRAEMWEVKPLDQSVIIAGKKLTEAKSQTIAINWAKWHAAQMYCKQYGLHFRVVTEQEIFAYARR